MFLPIAVILGFWTLVQPCDFFTICRPFMALFTACRPFAAVFTACRPFVLVTRGAEAAELSVILVVGANFGHLEEVAVELA